MKLKQCVFPKVDPSEVTSERQQREMVSPALFSLFLCIRNASNCRKHVQKKCSAAEPCYSQWTISIYSSQGAWPCFLSAEEYAKQISDLYYEAVDKFQA